MHLYMISNQEYHLWLLSLTHVPSSRTRNLCARRKGTQDEGAHERNTGLNAFVNIYCVRCAIALRVRVESNDAVRIDGCCLIAEDIGCIIVPVKRLAASSASEDRISPDEVVFSAVWP